MLIVYNAIYDGPEFRGNSYFPLSITWVALSMAVNTMVTGLIVFRILRATEFKSTSVERTLGAAGNKYRHIIFVIIESAMALFAIQLVRVVLGYIPVSMEQAPFMVGAENIVISINQMLNVIIIRSAHYFCLLITFTWLGHHTNDNFGAGYNGIVLRRRRFLQGSRRKSSF